MNTAGISIPRTRDVQMDFDPQTRELRDIKDRAWLMRESIRNLQGLGAPIRVNSSELSTYTTGLATLMTDLTTLLTDVVAIEALLDND